MDRQIYSWIDRCMEAAHRKDLSALLDNYISAYYKMDVGCRIER